MSIIITVLGSHEKKKDTQNLKSQKAALLKKILGWTSDEYTPPKAPKFHYLLQQTLWDVPDNFFNRKIYTKGVTVFYCIDEEAEERPIATDIKEIHAQSPAKIILVGADKEKLEKLRRMSTTPIIEPPSQSNKKVGVRIHQTVSDVISASDSIANILDTIKTSKPEDKTNYYSKKYLELWNKGTENHTDKDTADYYAALKLLKDYCKSDSTDSTAIAYVKLAFTCHLGRTHHSTVRGLVREEFSKSSEKTVEHLLNTLKDKLKSEAINSEGSLATRIKFIQDMTNLNVFDFSNDNQKKNDLNKGLQK
ncbi:Uncharacterised protein [Legionella busanensis]|uniref:RavJ-like C-terminal domain-containing protein n=1 Tax=Legionella busanensis TaxID=190655 RepID=A0A378JSR4_9GAMM|nr:DUF5617 domain-containing protein [Legionella busanensis]STX51212.1 Uncharacterised protein [Legionella busanensis]